MSASDELSVPQNDGIQKSSLDFPVIGIGASAGGLAALMRLFENLPATNPMAFVVILHLSPHHESSAAAVLQRSTKMRVVQVTESQKIESNTVYVIAPSKQLQMTDGMLKVTEADRPPGQHIAIDVFFRTLSDAHRERAIGVVLSGTGGDGAVGITRVKEQGGITIAQAPSDAEHDGMPSAAIETGVIDFVLPVVDIPQKLIELWDTSRKIQLPELGNGEAPIALPTDVLSSMDAEDALKKVIAQLCSNTGHDFRHYKRATVLRRIERRMQVRGMLTLPAYRRLLEEDPAEYSALLKDMLIGVTNFFRDHEFFFTLEREIIPSLFKNREPDDEVRAWSAACSTGEEAYSVAMLLNEQSDRQSKAQKMQVFASDIDEHAISVARAGRYPSSITTDVSPTRLREFFTKDDDHYCIRKTVRDRVLFAAHNLLRDPPFSNLDLITCRNLLIYLNRDVQLKVLEMFHFALKPDGILFLGSSESADAAAHLFVPVDKKARIYRSRGLTRVPFTPSVIPPPPQRDIVQAQVAKIAPKRVLSLADVHQRALARFGPPSMIVDSDSNIVHMSQGAGKYLRMVGGEPSRNLLALVMPELRLELRTALFRAHQAIGNLETRSVSLRDVADTVVHLTVQSFHDEEASSNFVLVMFDEVMMARDEAMVVESRENPILNQLEAELQRTKELLQETIEHSEVSNEEQRATNEELQAINEELRSATEELETSKEELQSVNEELVTVNFELKLKVEETSKANDDLKNLIASTNIATVFVDSAMRIKRFTPPAAEIFSIIPSDIGRSLMDITHRLHYDELATDAAKTFDSLLPVEREVRGEDGRYYIVRLLPYRTADDKIEGAVMTFFDITRRRLAEKSLLEGEARMRLVAESTKDYAIITQDTEGRITSWNNGAERIFGYTEEEVLGHPGEIIFTDDDRANGVPEDELRRAREDGRAEDERWHQRKNATQVYCSGVMTPMNDGTLFGYAKIARDQTERIEKETMRDAALSDEQIGRSNAENASALKDEFLAIMSHELRHPLNLIHINVELLARLPELKNAPLSQKATAVIRNAVECQSKIIEDLLDMSRIRTGKLRLTFSQLDLAAKAADVVSQARQDPEMQDLTLELEGAEDALVANADPVRIEQILLNLLSNAAKFTPAGGKITLRLSREGGIARIVVEDTGQGIAPEFLPHVFEMFGQAGAPASRGASGLGIGLALVREIAVLHGGWIEAASPGLGKGTKITLSLPLEAQPRIRERPVPPPISAIVAGKTILLIDDIEDVVSSFQALLEFEGAVVYTTTRGKEGLALLREHKFDMIISDISMPDMDGYAFIRKVREIPELAHIPAIVVTGLAQEKDRVEALAAGYTAHIAKPVSIDVLTDAICNLTPATGGNGATGS